MKYIVNYLEKQYEVESEEGFSKIQHLNNAIHAKHGVAPFSAIGVETSASMYASKVHFSTLEDKIPNKKKKNIYITITQKKGSGGVTLNQLEAEKIRKEWADRDKLLLTKFAKFAKKVTQ